MKKKLLYLILSYCTILISCDRNKLHMDFYANSLPPKIYPKKSKFILVRLKKEKIINNNNTNFNIQSFVTKGDSLIYFVYNYNMLAKFNLQNKRLEKINLPKQIRGSIVSFYVVNTDSIFFAQNMPTKLYLYKPNDENSLETFPLKKIKFNATNTIFNKRTNLFFFKDENYNLDFNNLFYNKKDKTITIGIEPFDSHILTGFEKTNRIGIYNLKIKKWIKLYGKPYGLMALRGNFTFGNNFLSFKDILIKGDTAFIHYKINHTVSCYINNKFYKELNFSSIHSKQILKPLKQKEANDIEKNKSYFYATPFYKGIYYHSKLKLYTRLYFDKQKSLNIVKKYNTNNKRDVYIIFMDEYFNYVGEQKLDKKINASKLIPISDGFVEINKINEINNLVKYKIIENE